MSFDFAQEDKSVSIKLAENSIWKVFFFELPPILIGGLLFRHERGFSQTFISLAKAFLAYHYFLHPAKAGRNSQNLANLA